MSKSKECLSQKSHATTCYHYLPSQPSASAAHLRHPICCLHCSSIICTSQFTFHTILIPSASRKWKKNEEEGNKTEAWFLCNTSSRISQSLRGLVDHSSLPSNKVRLPGSEERRAHIFYILRCVLRRVQVFFLIERTEIWFFPGEQRRNWNEEVWRTFLLERLIVIMRIRLMMFVSATASLIPFDSIFVSQTHNNNTHTALCLLWIDCPVHLFVFFYFFAFLLSSLTVTRVWATLLYQLLLLSLLQLVFTVWWLRGVGVKWEKRARDERRWEKKKEGLSCLYAKEEAMSLLLTFAFLLLVKSLQLLQLFSLHLLRPTIKSIPVTHQIVLFFYYFYSSFLSSYVLCRLPPSSLSTLASFSLFPSWPNVVSGVCSSIASLLPSPVPFYLLEHCASSPPDLHTHLLHIQHPINGVTFLVMSLIAWNTLQVIWIMVRRCHPPSAHVSFLHGTRLQKKAIWRLTQGTE